MSLSESLGVNGEAVEKGTPSVLDSLRRWLAKARNFPFLVLYAWLWKHHRSLLLRTFAYSYVAPVLLELVPFVPAHPIFTPDLDPPLSGGG